MNELYQRGIAFGITAGYADGVRDAVAYLAEVYGDEVYDTNVFDRLDVHPEG